MSDHDHSCEGAHEGESPRLSCREITEFLLAYLERELDEEAREHFEYHLKLCPPCGHYLDSYRDTVALVRDCAQPLSAEQRRKHAPPEGLIQAILSARRHMGPKKDLP